jgi:hypothetical protein
VISNRVALERNTWYDCTCCHGSKLPDWNKTMPALVTRTIRIREDQELEISTKYQGISGFLFRELYDIFAKEDMPGAAIMRLRKSIKENGNG